MVQSPQSADLHHCLEEALVACEQLLDERNPTSSYEPIAAMTRCLVTLRNQLITEQRGGAPVRSQLDRVNSIVSLATSTEYPLVGVRWDRVSRMCELLHELRQELSQEAAPSAENR